MRIVCPSCEAEYEVPDALLGGKPRNVRCAKCAREWAPFAPPPPAPEPAESFASLHAAPPAAMPEAETPAVGTLADQAPPIVTKSTKRREPKVPGSAPGLGIVIAWLFTAAIIAAGIGVLWLKRAEVVSFWPPARRLYILFGLDF